MRPRSCWGSLCLAALLSLALGARAQHGPFPRFELPVACLPKQECWVVNHVDLDPSEGRRDYRCGAMTYDGHRGTDFGIVHGGLESLRGDTGVFAAAPGVVRGVRDGVPDNGTGANGAARQEGRECGNGVVVAHENGWTTQYCHLAQGSVTVRVGERVASGQKLGRIGMSGMAAFPHVHFQVAHAARIVDPFSGPQATAPQRCALAPDTLWSPGALAALEYPASRVVSATWLKSPPDADPVSVPAQELARWTGNFPVFFRAIFLGVSPGDQLRVTVVDPSGKTVAENRSVTERAQIRVSMWVQIPSLANMNTSLSGEASITSGGTLHRSGPVRLSRTAER